MKPETFGHITLYNADCMDVLYENELTVARRKKNSKGMKYKFLSLSIYLLAVIIPITTAIIITQEGWPLCFLLVLCAIDFSANDDEDK